MDVCGEILRRIEQGGQVRIGLTAGASRIKAALLETAETERAAPKVSFQ